MHKHIIVTLMLVIIIGIGLPAYAKDFGKIGQTYPIKEMDLLGFIQARLKQMQQSGELQKKQKEMLDKARTSFERPEPVKGITSTKSCRKWMIDPSTIIKNDITGVDGKIIIRGGTIVNPLNHVSLRSTFVFYDGDNKAQVAWAVKQDKLLKGKTKLILVNGSIIEQGKLFKKKILFDQHGHITNKLKIQHTPAIAAQEGKEIRVEEVLP